MGLLSQIIAARGHELDEKYLVAPLNSRKKYNSAQQPHLVNSFFNIFPLWLNLNDTFFKKEPMLASRQQEPEID